MHHQLTPVSISSFSTLFLYHHRHHFISHHSSNLVNMPPRSYALGRSDEASHPDTMRAVLAEFVSTLIFVFAGEGSVLALDKIYSVSPTTPSDIVLVALAHALALFAAVSAAINISGGHLNPAVTFGALIGGRVSLIRAVFYWIAQLLGAIVASLLLRFVTNNMVIIINFDHIRFYRVNTMF